MAIPDYSQAKRGSASIFYDPRSPFQKFIEVAAEHPFYVITPVVAAMFMFLFPVTFLLGVLLVTYFRLCYKAIPDVLPMFLPIKAKNKVDKNNKLPGGGLGKPEGAIFFGNLISNGKELWAKFETALRHILVLGTTGAGKTEFLLSIFANFLAIGAGGIYSDGKGTANLMYVIKSFARIMGVEDDVLYLNYAKENTAVRPDPANFQSHSCAPFSTGSADNGVQLTVSLMPEDSGSSNKVFQEAAVALIAALFPALTDLRELGIVQITPGIIRHYSNYDRFSELIRDPLISHKSREGLLGFIRSRSGYTNTKSADDQPEEVTKQFGFAQAYFTRALQLLSDSYSNIYNDPSADLDFIDLILNDRILCNVLPSMSKSPQEMGNLGKINLTSIKNALSIGLTADVQGTYENVVESLATNTDVPVICINDEIAFYLAEGFMITAAQARSLKMVMLFSSQEFASIMKAGDKEAEQMWGNTRLKFLMASEGDKETIERFIASAGKVWAYIRGGLKRSENDETFGRDYVNGDQVQLQQIDKMEVDDVRQLNEGRAAMIYQEKLLLIKTFYHNCHFKAPQLRILRGVVPHVEPTHGAYARVLSSTNCANLFATKEWIKNMQQGDIDFKKVKNISERAQLIPTLQPEFDSEREWSAAQHGIAMLYGFGNSHRIMEMRKNGADIDAAEPGFLFNASGSFGDNDNVSHEDPVEQDIDDDNKNDEIQRMVDNMFATVKSGGGIDFTEAIKRIRGDIEETNNQSKPVQEPTAAFSLASIITEDTDDDDFSLSNTATSSTPLTITGDSDDSYSEPGAEESDYAQFDPSDTNTATLESLLPEATMQRIASGTEKLEKLLGASQLQASLSAEKTISDVLAATQYPKTKLVPESNTRDRIRELSERFVKDNLKK